MSASKMSIKIGYEPSNCSSENKSIQKIISKDARTVGSVCEFPGTLSRQDWVNFVHQEHAKDPVFADKLVDYMFDHAIYAPDESDLLWLGENSFICTARLSYFNNITLPSEMTKTIERKIAKENYFSMKKKMESAIADFDEAKRWYSEDESVV